MSLQTAMETEDGAYAYGGEKDSEIYVLNSETNETDGPYTLDEVAGWYASELLQEDTFISVDGSEWVEVGHYMNGTKEAEEVGEAEETEEEGDDDEEDQVYTLGSDNDVNGPYTLADIRYWVEHGDMLADVLVSVPDSMQDALGDDWVEVQSVLDHFTMQEYETWRQDDDDFDW